MIFYRLSAYLWWSRFRWIFEPVVRRLLRRKSEIQTGPLRGYKFRGGIAQMLGIYEISIQKAIHHHLPLGGVFYDIGANNGFFSLYASWHVGVGGKVFSFEPLPGNAENIRKLIQENSLSNCWLEESAVSDSVGKTELYFGDSIATPSIVQKEGRGETSMVPTISLDSFIVSHPIPDLVKLDVEGAETAVLKGAKSLLSIEIPPKWIIEIHDPKDEEAIYSLLAPGDYGIKKMSKPGKQVNQFPIHIVASPHEK
jgi:FkbM family methyltransferase